MIGIGSDSSVALTAHQSAHGWKPLFALCLFCGMLMGMLSAPAWSADAQGVVQKKLSTSPERLFVQWQTAKQGALRALVDVPAQPRAAVILFAGDNGCLGLTENGDQTSLQGNFLARSRELFAKEGLVAVLLDVPTSISNHSANSYRTSAEQAQDAAMVMEFVRKQWHVPVVLVGTSRGTISAANTAARLEHGNADALVVSSTVTQNSKKNSGTIYNVDLGRISIPVLILHNEQDACKVSPYSGVAGLQHAFKNAPRKDVIALSHADAIADACQGMSAHGFLGIEGQAVSAISNWIYKNTPAAQK